MNPPPASSATSAPEQPPASQPRAINFATEWLDEDGRVCPKNVDYATQCPKGHDLVSVSLGGGGGAQAQQASGADVMCRVCHTSTVRQHARAAFERIEGLDDRAVRIAAVRVDHHRQLAARKRDEGADRVEPHRLDEETQDSLVEGTGLFLQACYGLRRIKGGAPGGSGDKEFESVADRRHARDLRYVLAGALLRVAATVHPLVMAVAMRSARRPDAEFVERYLKPIVERDRKRTRLNCSHRL